MTKPDSNSCVDRPLIYVHPDGDYWRLNLLGFQISVSVANGKASMAINFESGSYVNARETTQDDQWVDSLKYLCEIYLKGGI